MPARAKGARLYLREARADRGAIWVILDRGREYRTGCGADDIAGAEEALRRHLSEVRVAATAKSPRDPSGLLIADVIALYARDKAPKHARPHETAARLDRLLAWWGAKRLSEVTGASCRAYVASRSSPAAARRELEELRAAINHHRMEGLCDRIVSVRLPDRSVSRERWLTRQEAAKLIRAAWRYREVQRGEPTDRRSRRHVARFILLALYTGSRAAAVCGAALGPREGTGWIDLDRGIFYRRGSGERDTRKRRPPVPLPARLLAHLRRWHRRGQRWAVEFDGRKVKDVDKAFRRVAEDAGLPDVTPHALRHTAATWLMQAGCDRWEAAGYLGMTPETLDRVYGHHHPDHLAGARRAMDSRGSMGVSMGVRQAKTG